jgi:hypothetical protein
VANQVIHDDPSTWAFFSLKQASTEEFLESGINWTLTSVAHQPELREWSLEGIQFVCFFVHSLDCLDHLLFIHQGILGCFQVFKVVVWCDWSLVVFFTIIQVLGYLLLLIEHILNFLVLLDLTNRVHDRFENMCLVKLLKPGVIQGVHSWKPVVRILLKHVLTQIDGFWTQVAPEFGREVDLALLVAP